MFDIRQMRRTDSINELVGKVKEREKKLLNKDDSSVDEKELLKVLSKYLEARSSVKKVVMLLECESISKQ